MTRLSSWAVAIVLLVLLPGGATAQAPPEATSMVDVWGSATRVLTLGLAERDAGEPVIVLQGGAGSPIESWGPVIPAVAEFAPVVAYDRPGIGKSPFDGVAPTLDRVVAHLHELLEVLEAPPPYILVGHSWGGPQILFYAGAHPKDVVGMVYVDPSDPLRRKADFIPPTEDEAQREAMRAELDKSYEAWLEEASPGRRAEGAAIMEFEDMAIEDRGIPPTPRVPTAIILGTLFEPSEDAPSFFDEDFNRSRSQLRIGRFQKWTLDLPEATLVVASHAGHFVHTFDANLVVEAIRRVRFPDITARLVRAQESDGTAAMIEAYHVVKKRYPPERFYETLLNRLGYRFLQNGQLDKAIAVFELNVAEYPDAFNPWDSLGEGYMIKGDREKAIENYRKSLELNPDNESAVEQLEKLGAR